MAAKKDTRKGTEKKKSNTKTPVVRKRVAKANPAKPGSEPKAGAPAEIQRFSSELRSALENGMTLEKPSAEQVQDLGRKTGMDSDKVRVLWKSNRMAGSDENLAGFYYGLLSQKIPADPASLLNRGRESVIRVLKRAETANLIPPLERSEVDRIFDEVLPRLRAESLLKPVRYGAPSSLGDLLRTMPAGLPEQLQRKVADLTLQGAVDFEKLPGRLQNEGFSRDQAVLVERTLRLGELTLSHAPLVRHLQGRLKSGADGSLKPLASLRRDQWIELAYTFRLPDGRGIPPEAYAEKIERALEVHHPTEVLAARLAEGALAFRDPGLEHLGRFIRDNPAFDIRRTNIRVFSNKAAFANVADRDQLVGSLLKLQRVYKLSANWEEAGLLLNQGLESALDIVQAGRENLVRRFSGQADPKRIEAIFGSAKKTQQLALGLMSRIMPRFSPTTVDAMKQTLSLSDSAARESYPTLQALFGPLDGCECRHDQSVLGPAAYFVDLMQFLRKDKTEMGPLGPLMSRRPDLADLLLSSENTDIELPYVDLVVELLENAVSLPRSIKLPVGVDVNAALSSDPVSPAIVDILQETASDLIDRDLRVVQDNRFQSNPICRIWTVADAKRRWIVLSQSKGFGVESTGGTIKLDLSKAASLEAFQTLISELDGGRLSEASKGVLAGLMQSQGDKIVLVLSDQVKVKEPGKRWIVKATLGVSVSVAISGDSGTLTLTSPGGKTLFTQEYQASALSATVDGLNQGRIAGPLAGLLPAYGAYTIQPLGGGVWLVKLPLPDFTLTYEQDLLFLYSLGYQTVGRSAELSAAPENSNPLPYRDLRKAVFPWSLPFHLSLESVRAMLEKAGVPRRRLIEALDPQGYLENQRWARETLGLTLEEAEIVTTPAEPSALWVQWGVKPDAQGVSRVFDATGQKDESGPPLALLSRLSILMQQARLAFHDVEGLLSTSFVDVSPLHILPLEAGGNLCCPRNLTLDGLTPDHLDRIHRLTRLWRRLGWPLADLDRAIRVFSVEKMLVPEGLDRPKPAPLPPGAPEHFGEVGEKGGVKVVELLPAITPDVLKKLAHLCRLRELLGLSAGDLAVWWDDSLLRPPVGATGRDAKKSLYELIFLNPLLQNPPDPDFLLDAEGSALLHSGVKISAKAHILSAALGLRAQDFSSLFSGSGLEDRLTLGKPLPALPHGRSDAGPGAALVGLSQAEIAHRDRPV